MPDLTFDKRSFQVERIYSPPVSMESAPRQGVSGFPELPSMAGIEATSVISLGCHSDIVRGLPRRACSWRTVMFAVCA